MSDAYRSFGRGTPAGDLLFQIYNKPSKPSTFDPEFARLLRELRVKREANAEPEPKPVPKSRAHVNVPRPSGRRAYGNDNIDSVPRFPSYMPYGRKPEAVIAQELAEQQRELERQPAPDKKFISGKDKEHLQLMMQYNGEIPAQPAPKPRPVTPPPAPKLSEKELFDAIVQEIEDRKLFLDDMRRLGMGKKYDTKIKSEIAARVAELRKLDRQLAAQAEKMAADMMQE